MKYIYSIITTEGLEGDIFYTLEKFNSPSDYWKEIIKLEADDNYYTVEGETISKVKYDNMSNRLKHGGRLFDQPVRCY